MASGNTLVTLYPTDNEPPSSSYATLDTRNGHLCLDHDDTTDESSIFTFIMPRAYAGGGVTVYPHVAFTSATSGVGRLDIAFERIGDGSQDIDSDGFASAQSVDITAPGTSGNVESSTSVAFTDGAQMDSIAAGELCRIKVTRDANHANDTASGDLELLGLEIKET